MIRVASPLAQYRSGKAAIDAAIARVLDGGGYVLGREVEQFEESFAAYVGTSHAVGVGNGTDALALALRAIGVGRGDEVITVSHTAIATLAAIIATGATPVLVDIERERYTLDPERLAAAIGPRTRAIVPVHLYGQVADMPAIVAIARRHGVKVIEDCAQAVGATLGGRKAGTFGDLASFSFYPTKNLGAIGDGGMVCTGNARLAGEIRRLRQYGWDEKRVTRRPGVNSRLDPMQAAILGAKLPELDRHNARRAAIAARYTAGLAGLPLAAPVPSPGVGHGWHLYVVACRDRNALRKSLSDRSIDTAIHYSLPAHRHRGYAELSRIPKPGLPVTEAVVRRIVSLPLYPELSDGDADRVIEAVRDHYATRGRR